MDDFPVLYVLMRTDMASLNPGKAVAQGCHAANLMTTMVEDEEDQDSDRAISGMVRAWLDQGNGFGTTIVLGVNERLMRNTVDNIKNTRALDDRVLAGIVTDDTYPLKDGDALHFVRIDTCAFVFGTKALLAPYLSHLDLMP